MFFDLSLNTVLLRMAALLLISAMHGFAVSAAARLLGDPGPSYDGRLTPNPFAHADLFGGVALIVFGAGWIRPISVDVSILRGGPASAVLIVLASVLASLGAVALLAAFLPLVATSFSDATALTAMTLILVAARLSVGFALFNLFPMPPLTGGYLLDAAWPSAARFLRRHAAVSAVALFALLATGLPQQLMTPGANPLIWFLVNDGPAGEFWR